MDEEGRVGILMCAGCAFVCVFLFVSIALTEVAMQDRRLVSCADALSSVAVGSSSSDDFFDTGNPMGVDEASAGSRVEGALAALSDSTCKVGEGVVLTGVSVRGTEVEVAVRARPNISLLPPFLRASAVPELDRTSSARLRDTQPTG